MIWLSSKRLFFEYSLKKYVLWIPAGMGWDGMDSEKGSRNLKSSFTAIFVLLVFQCSVYFIFLGWLWSRKHSFSNLGSK